LNQKEGSMSNKFCSIPWIGMFYHNNLAKVCCVSTHKSWSTPIEFRKSKFVTKLKQEFLEGGQPASCKACWDLEDAGMRSVRQNLMSGRPEHTIDKFNLESEYNLEYLEFRASNLCNFSCVICSPESSTQLGKAVTKHPILLNYFSPDRGLDEITDPNWQQIKSVIRNIKQITLAGGEPMLIKHYYQLLDHLIETGQSKQVLLSMTTNGSVLNPTLLDKFNQFKTTRITVSIDGVGKRAEYQRYGTDWEVVKQNCITFAKTPGVDLVINTAISAYTVLGFSDFADFMIELYNTNDSVRWTGTPVFGHPEIQYTMLNPKLREKALVELNSAKEKLTQHNFSFMIPQIAGVIEQLSKTDNYGDFSKFITFTDDIDKVQKIKFKDAFGFDLLPSSNFCPAPWISMFYHTNSPKICCFNKNWITETDPSKVRNSVEVKELKKSFIDNDRHNSCSDCWKQEDQGFKSVRQFYNLIYPDVTLNTILKNPKTELLELELRSSTLCNFACRMCGPKDSSLIAKEIADNPQIKKFYSHSDNQLEETSEENWQKLLKQTHSLRKLVLTGGEPMLIKRYYEMFDYLDQNDLCKNIGLSMVTNTSVLNPKIVDRFNKFKKIKIALSIDGVGPTAEYQRYGTEWSVVRENVLTYARMFQAKSLYNEDGTLPDGVDGAELDELIINITITAYSVLDFSSLAEFLVEVYEIYPHAWFIAHHVNWPDILTCYILPEELKKRAINELTLSIEKLSIPTHSSTSHAVGFNGIIEDLSALIKQIQLSNNSVVSGVSSKQLIYDSFSETQKKFIDFTKETDLIRGQSFEKTFGYKLY